MNIEIYINRYVNFKHNYQEIRFKKKIYSEEPICKCSIKIYSKKFHKIHRKNSVLDSFFIKLQAKDCNFIEKETSVQVFFWEFCKIFQSNFSKELLRATASIYWTPFGDCWENYFKLHLTVHYVKFFNPLMSSVELLPKGNQA